MSDDSFIREVDEELRSDRVQNIWKKYGKLLIGGAVAIVVVTAGNQYYQNYTATRAASQGDAFMEAVRLSNTGKVDESLDKLKALEGDGSKSYAALARLRMASELAKKGDVESAIKEYDAVAATGAADQNLRSIARLRAGFLLVDSGTVADVETRVGPLMGPGAPYRLSAREAMALAYFKMGDAPSLKKAADLYAEIVSDSTTPSSLGQRARLMNDLIASKGGPAAKK